MRTTQCVRAGWVIGAVGACMLVAGAARADVTTERPGSILIFPKVVCNGTRDTVIQISNTDNMIDQARCFYINGAKGRNGVAQCNETDFLISLTKQQPTVWDCEGRSPTGESGLGPGLVPPLPAGFTGALVCAEVDASLTPIARNKLTGQATLFGPGISSSKYNGIAFPGNTSGGNNGDNDLTLNGGEYSACPAASRVNFVTPGAPDPIVSGLGNAGVCINDSFSPCTTTSDCAVGTCARLTCFEGSNNGGPCASDLDCPGGSCNGPALASVTTTVTVLPCNLDLNAQLPTTTTIQVKAWDETEQPFTTSFPVTCWGNFDIASAAGPGLAVNAVRTQFGTLELYSGTGGPFLAVIETLRSDSVGNSASATTNTHVEPRVCVGSATLGVNGSPCTADSDCSGGTCPLPSAVIRLPGA
jgi:hypothetical protein